MLRTKLRSSALPLLAATALAACDPVPDPPQGLEVALVVDNSASMSLDGRLQDLRTGVSRFVAVLEKRWTGTDAAGREAQLWLSLLPYSGRVNLEAHPEFFDPAPADPRLACPDPRDGGLGQDDSPLSLGLLSNPRMARSAGYLEKRLCPATAMVGPTRRLDLVRDAVTGLKAKGGCTRFDLATIWGWRAVSPLWWPAWHGEPDADPPPQRPSAKAVILVTDGSNTPSCAMDRVSRKQADALFLAACAAMQGQGIRVYTIYLGKPYKRLQDTLDGCAGAAGRARHAPDGEALIGLFEQLAEEVAALRPRA